MRRGRSDPSLRHVDGKRAALVVERTEGLGQARGVQTRCGGIRVVRVERRPLRARTGADGGTPWRSRCLGGGGGARHAEHIGRRGPRLLGRQTCKRGVTRPGEDVRLGCRRGRGRTQRLLERMVGECASGQVGSLDLLAGRRRARADAGRSALASRHRLGAGVVLKDVHVTSTLRVTQLRLRVVAAPGDDRRCRQELRKERSDCVV
ncbi:hypothetical protein FA09DRAFT_23289 [Tilletiopsis washingtonensis]|uniref:Uncharacterized protein n=1 Tax=Tilletiopsis washingtonensis TaxID=58919 RepID=A0A316Z8Z9_9BASI|nr:hypothetical protein FA09DRAFT_23289 [Tilletiopsis washingtonensis]PWN98260.1 hypothetical protein FA09DRAFT_23289 [Tilletiopsis washingtonensis]